jgi:hypothetical protein
VVVSKVGRIDFGTLLSDAPCFASHALLVAVLYITKDLKTGCPPGNYKTPQVMTKIQKTG